MNVGRSELKHLREELTALRLRAEQAEKERDALVDAIHKALGRIAESDKKQTIEQLVSDIAFLGRVAKDHFNARVQAEARCKMLEEALDIIQSGFELRNGDPKMNGTFEKHPHLLDRKRMMEIARQAMEDK